jgi:hypothetical protein
MAGTILLTVLLAFYFIPSIVAGARGHRQGGAIFALNLFLGWTLLGWVVALVWSLTSDTAAPAAASQNVPQFPDTRACPRCAEEIKAAAKVCRFCGSDVDPLPAPPPAEIARRMLLDKY